MLKNYFTKKNLNFKYLVLIFLIVYSSWCALNIGMHWDANTHLNSGANKLRYLFSFGRVENFAHFDKYFPGVSFAIYAFIIKIFPQNFKIEILHFVNLIYSISGIIVFCHVTKKLFNKKFRDVFFLVLITFAVYFGHMAINLKDAVMATSYLWVYYLTFKYLKKQDKFNLESLLIFSFILSVGTGVRLVFISSLLPLIILTLIEIHIFKKIIKKSFDIKKFYFDLFRIIILFYLILLIFWAETHENILLLPFKILIDSLQTDKLIGVGYSILNGDIFTLDQSPKSYFLINLFFKTPEYLIISLFYFFYIFAFKNEELKKIFKNFNYIIFAVLFIIIFTNLIFLFSPFGFYDGIRQFLFIIPIILILPVISIVFCFQNMKQISNKIFICAITPLILMYAFNFISLTPYHYTYLNIFAKNHELNFENDYLGTSIKNLIKKSNFLNTGSTKVTFCGYDRNNLKYYFKKFGYSNIQIVRYNEDPQYIIMLNRVTSKNSNCFVDFQELEDVSFIKSNNIILSRIKKYN